MQTHQIPFADPGVASFWMASNTQDPFVPGKLTRGSVHLVSESGVQVGDQWVLQSQPILTRLQTYLSFDGMDEGGLRSRQLVRGWRSNEKVGCWQRNGETHAFPYPPGLWSISQSCPKQYSRRRPRLYGPPGHRGGSVGWKHWDHMFQRGIVGRCDVRLLKSICSKCVHARTNGWELWEKFWNYSSRQRLTSTQQFWK